MKYVGFLERIGLTRGSSALASVTPIEAARSRVGISSPWSTGQLTEFAWSDVFGDAATQPLTREAAMTLPPIVNSRALIIGELSTRPLRAIKNGALTARQPAWLYRTNTSESPQLRLAKTFDDWIFYKDCVWATERGADKQITDAMHMPRDRWRLNDLGQIEVTVDGNKWFPARAEDVVYLPGPFDGLLTVAARTIRAAINLESSWANRAATPLPSILLAQREQGELDPTEVQAVVNGAAEARRNPNGAVMFIPYEYVATIEGDTDSQMMVEARNAYKLDIANFLGMDAGAIDAALPKASLNYETQDGTAAVTERRLSYWTGPLEARLSMDDVCPRGQRIAFDFSNNPTEPGEDTGPFQED